MDIHLICFLHKRVKNKKKSFIKKNLLLKFMEKPQSSQRAELIKEIKNLQREKKIFFPPPISKLNLVQLNDMLNELKNTKSENPNLSQEQKLFQQTSQIISTQKTSGCKTAPPLQERNEAKDMEIDDSDLDDKDDIPEVSESLNKLNIEPIRKVKETPHTILQDKKEVFVDKRFNPITEEEVDEELSLFNEDVILMLDTYDINNMSDVDISEISDEWDELVRELNLALSSCVDRRLRSKITRCINNNRKTVYSYIN